MKDFFSDRPQTARSIQFGLRDLLPVLKSLLSSPIETMKDSLRLDWASAVLIQVVVAGISGAIAGASTRQAIGAVVGAALFAILALMTVATVTLFIYSYFSIFQSTFLDMRRLYSAVILAHLPFFILHSLSGYLAPLDLIGYAAAMIMLSVALVEQFSLARFTVLRLNATLYGFFFLIWMGVQVLAGY